MESDKLTVHVTADDMRPTYEAIVHTALDEITRQIVVLAERLNHMQDRLDRQGARLRRIESLPGVAAAIAAAERAS